mgnify:CR=1 FL=1
MVPTGSATCTATLMLDDNTVAEYMADWMILTVFRNRSKALNVAECINNYKLSSLN